MSGRRFPSRVDRWLIVLVGIPLVMGTLAMLVGFMVSPELSITEVVLGPLIMITVTGFLVWMFRATHYTVDGKVLKVRSGPVRFDIAIASITGIRRSRSILSSPALSLDRLEIRHGAGKKLMISPADREGFLRALQDAGLPARMISR